jgi:hypothetical protein
MVHAQRIVHEVPVSWQCLVYADTDGHRSASAKVMQEMYAAL